MDPRDTPDLQALAAPPTPPARLLAALATALVFGWPSAAMADTTWGRAVEFFTFRYDFLKTTVAGALMVGVTCGLLGTFLVLRRMSLMGDALGHAALPGVGLAFLLVGTKALAPMVLGATATAMAAALAVGFITRNARTYPDAALGMVLAAFFGLGVVLLSYIQNSPNAAKSGLSDFLFGNAAAIRPDELWLLGGLLVVTLGAVLVLYRPLQLTTFDPGMAASMGLPVRAIHYGLLGLVALTIVASIQSVGVVLVAAMLITPASTAYLLTDRLPVMLALSAGIGAASGLLGALMSYLFDGFSSGPSMVLVASTFFALAFLLAPGQGQLARWLRRRRKLAAAAARTTVVAGPRLVEPPSEVAP